MEEYIHEATKKELYVCSSCGAIFDENKKVIGMTFDGFKKLVTKFKEVIK